MKQRARGTPIFVPPTCDAELGALRRAWRYVQGETLTIDADAWRQVQSARALKLMGQEPPAELPEAVA